MSSRAKLDRDRAALVIIDMQEAFRRLPGFDAIARASATLARGASALGVPVIVTEQYPKGLGETVREVGEVLPAGVEPIEKVVFSATQADGFDLDGRDQAVVCGIEAHVCVSQTTLDMLADDVDVHVVIDAIGSRFDTNKQVGVDRMERAGAVLTSVETALFELVGRAGTDEFKTVQKLVLEFAPNP